MNASREESSTLTESLNTKETTVLTSLKQTVLQTVKNRKKKKKSKLQRAQNLRTYFPSSRVATVSATYLTNTSAVLPHCMRGALCMHRLALPPQDRTSQKGLSPQRNKLSHQLLPQQPSPARLKQVHIQRAGFYLNQPLRPTTTKQKKAHLQVSQRPVNLFLPPLVSHLYFGKPHPTAPFLCVLLDIINCFYFYLPYL